MDEFTSDGLALEPFAVDNSGHEGVFRESSAGEHAYACGKIGGEAHGYAFAKKARVTLGAGRSEPPQGLMHSFVVIASHANRRVGIAKYVACGWHGERTEQ